jgi:hypothetical protein
LHLLLIAILPISACGGGAPTPFPTAGVTVQPFPNVEIILPSSTPVPTFTPLPSDTPLPTSTSTSLPTATPWPTLTATPLIQLAPPTATFPRAPTARPTRTSAPTATPPPAAAPIRFHGEQFVKFVSAEYDPARPPNGSFDTLSVEFTGSRPPFTVKHDGQVVVSASNGDGKFDDSGVIYTFIHFRIARMCGGAIVGTVTIIGGDGQSITQAYYVPDSQCP